MEIDDYCVVLSLHCIEAAEAQDVGADPKRVVLSMYVRYVSATCRCTNIGRVLVK